MDRIDEENSSFGNICSPEAKSKSDHLEISCGKERLSDRFVPFRWDDESKNFYELSCSLANPENSKALGINHTIETEQEEKVKNSYSSFLAKKMFNFRLDYSSPNVIDHENQESQASEIDLSLIGVPSGLLGETGILYSGVKQKGEKGQPGSLILSRGIESSGSGKILKYKSTQRFFFSDQTQFSQSSDDDLIDFESAASPVHKQYSKSIEISTSPTRILEAPGLKDDFYYNLIDWGKQNIMAVSLSNRMYLWNACTSQVAILSEATRPCHYTSVQWSLTGSILSLGTSNGNLEVWDLPKMKRILSKETHTMRLGNMQWLSEAILASSSRDRTIAITDIRANRISSRFLGHKQEVCGLRWSPSCDLLASGGNEYRIHVWSLHKDKPICSMNYHKSAVKALDWNPRQRGILLSGGGNSDKTIKVFNTFTQKLVKEVNVGNQVCNIRFSKNSNQFVSSHGFTKNDISLWNYETLDQIVRMEGHMNRVLYMCMGPDDETIATAAGDEVIKFWKVFPQEKKPKNEIVNPTSFLLR